MFDLLPYRRNQIRTYNPYSEMENFTNSFFNNFFGERSLNVYQTDITDEGDSYRLKTDLPGFRREDIHLELQGDALVLTAERHSEYEEKDKREKYIRCERSYGTFSRSFDVTGVQTDKISAKYEDGVLTICLPKKEDPAAPRQVSIE